jgi:hypothetical protein
MESTRHLTEAGMRIELVTYGRKDGRGQEVIPEDVLVVFSARAWNSLQESWDDYFRALERAYAQYVERARRAMLETQTLRAPDSDDQRH